jgi:hypothetical protein
MYDADDHFTRWVHALSAIPVGLFILIDVYFLFTSPLFALFAIVRNSLGAGAIFLEYRLIKYAITGRDCINNLSE